MIRSSLSPVLHDQTGEDFTTWNDTLLQWKWNLQSHPSPLRLKSKFLGMAHQVWESPCHRSDKMLLCCPPCFPSSSPRAPAFRTTFGGPQNWRGSQNPPSLFTWPFTTFFSSALTLDFTSMPDHRSLHDDSYVSPWMLLQHLCFPHHSSHGL